MYFRGEVWDNYDGEKIKNKEEMPRSKPVEIILFTIDLKKKMQKLLNHWKKCPWVEDLIFGYDRGKY